MQLRIFRYVVNGQLVHVEKVDEIFVRAQLTIGMTSGSGTQREETDKAKTTAVTMRRHKFVSQA